VSVPPIDPDRFRAVLGRFATGVSVMTTVVDGVPHGMTASAVSSVSLEPPLVLVCVERGAVMATQVAASGVFALSFLADVQADLSAGFADPSRPEGHAQFTGLATSEAVTGALIVDGCVAWVDCRTWATYDGGDHLIVVGEVVALGAGGVPEGTQGPRPLLYYSSGYGRFIPGD
jgi:flavin reductase